jgi:hypothetical protein
VQVRQGDQIGRIFAHLGHSLLWPLFLQTKEKAQIFGLLWLSIKFDKNVSGYILGDFFESTSGHPDG